MKLGSASWCSWWLQPNWRERDVNCEAQLATEIAWRQGQSRRLFEFAKNLIGSKISELCSRLKCEFGIFVTDHPAAEQCSDPRLTCSDGAASQLSIRSLVKFDQNLHCRLTSTWKCSLYTGLSSEDSVKCWDWSFIRPLVGINDSNDEIDDKDDDDNHDDNDNNDDDFDCSSGVNLTIPPATRWPVPAC